MGLPVSLILIAVGAILAFAVNQSDPNPPVDVDVVGWILMLVGLVGGLLSLLLWDRLGPGALGLAPGWLRGPSWAGPRHRAAARSSRKKKRRRPPGPPGPPLPYHPRARKRRPESSHRQVPAVQGQRHQLRSRLSVERHDSTAVRDTPEHMAHVEQLREESDGPGQRPLDGQRMQTHVLARNNFPDGARVRVTSRITEPADPGRARSRETEVTGSGRYKA